MANFPQDQFDALPDDLLRVGAHRGPKAKGRGWVTFAWAALATGVIVVSGFYAVSRSGDSSFFEWPFSAASETPVATTEPDTSVQPVVDPSTVADRAITVTVLNGTATAGIQTIAGAKLTAVGWAVGSESTSSANDFTTTTVYFSDAANEDVARGIVQALGIGDVQLSDAYILGAAPITVVVGSDFVDLP